MSTAELRMSSLAPVRRREGARSTIVICAFLYARSNQKAKTLPAIPDPDMMIFGAVMMACINFPSGVLFNYSTPEDSNIFKTIRLYRLAVRLGMPLSFCSTRAKKMLVTF